MRSRTLATIALAATASMGFAGAAGAADGGRPYTVEMTGDQEAPGPGDPDGSGVATFRINPGMGTVCWTLEVSDIASATAAHIHAAPAGVAGPVMVPLGAPSDGSASGCADVERSLALDLIRNPADYYVNVHNAEFPAGAVRGQLG